MNETKHGDQLLVGAEVKEEKQELGQVDVRLPYAHLVAENPRLNGGDLIEYIIKCSFAGLLSRRDNGDALTDLETQALESINHFFDYLDQLNGNGPTMGEFMIMTNVLGAYEPLYKRVKDFVDSRDDSAQEAYNSVDFITNNLSSKLCYQMLLHYLLSGLDKSRRGVVLETAKQDFKNNLEPHLILSFLLKQKILSRVEESSIKKKYEQWKEREEPKYENMRQQFSSQDNSTPEKYAENFSRLTGENLFGYRIVFLDADRNGRGVEDGTHHIGCAIHKSFGPIIEEIK